MKKIFFLFVLIFTIRQSALAQCGAGSYTVTTNVLISGSCIVNGDLTILNGATLNVDLTSASADTFVVRGNILLQGNAVLWVHAASGSTGDQFIVSNSYSMQRTITTQDSSRIVLEYVEFRTQEGNLSSANSLYMNYFAKDHSIFYINKSWLNPQTAWLLCNMENKSTLIGYEPNRVPTEIYLQDTAEMVLHGPNTNTGVHLLFESTTDTLTLPSDQTKPYSWKIGRGLGGLKATQWYFEVDTAQPGLGVQIQPFAKLVVNGTGLPATGELGVNLLFAGSNDTVKNLKVGLQNTVVAKGRLTLNNVNLGPIAWMLYSVSDETLHIKNSTVNEIGIEGPGNTVVVDSSLIQLATLSALGTSSSTLTLNNSEIWSQAIVAANTGGITLNNCSVTGSWFSTMDAQSHITVNGGCFFQNSAGCTQNTMLNIMTGQPYCNPFIPSGFPQNLSPATVTFNGVNSNCATAVEDMSSNSERVVIYPNPFSSSTVIRFNSIIKNAEFAIYNIYGQNIKTINLSAGDSGTISEQAITLHRDNLPSGLYFIRLMQGDKVFSTGKLIITD